MSSFLLTAQSRNAKTGPMPVTTSSQDTCPVTCPFYAKGCYAKQGNLGMLWAKMSRALPGDSVVNGRSSVNVRGWAELLAFVRGIAAGALWRHNQAGDLPHTEGNIDAGAVAELVEANRGKRGFTYSHHDMNRAGNRALVKLANNNGFTVNISANNMAHADEMASLDVAPVVVVLPRDMGGKAVHRTPEGRKVVVCPATYSDTNCKDCGLCARLRDVIVGFPAHGAQAGAAEAVARG